MGYSSFGKQKRGIPIFPFFLRLLSSSFVFLLRSLPLRIDVHQTLIQVEGEWLGGDESRIGTIIKVICPYQPTETLLCSYLREYLPVFQSPPDSFTVDIRVHIQQAEFSGIEKEDQGVIFQRDYFGYTPCLHGLLPICCLFLASLQNAISLSLCSFIHFLATLRQPDGSFPVLITFRLSMAISPLVSLSHNT